MNSAFICKSCHFECNGIIDVFIKMDLMFKWNEEWVCMMEFEVVYWSVEVFGSVEMMEEGWVPKISADEEE